MKKVRSLEAAMPHGVPGMGDTGMMGDAEEPLGAGRMMHGEPVRSDEDFIFELLPH